MLQYRRTVTSMKQTSDLPKKKKQSSSNEAEILLDFGYDMQKKQFESPPVFKDPLFDEQVRSMVEVLAKESHERAPTDLRTIKAMLCSIPFFTKIQIKGENLQDADYVELSKIVRYQRFMPGEYVF